MNQPAQWKELCYVIEGEVIDVMTFQGKPAFCSAAFFFSELSMILYSVVKIVETVEPVLKTTGSFLTLFYT